MNTDLVLYCVIAFVSVAISSVNAGPDCWRDKNGNVRCVNI